MLSKFTTLTMLAATWVVVVAVPASAQAPNARMRFESMDQNRDGAISRDEWRGSDRGVSKSGLEWRRPTLGE